MNRPTNLITTEAWVAFFLLGIAMLNSPFLEIFNKTLLVFDLPLLFLYFFIGWPISILVIYLFVRDLGDDPAGHSDDRGRDSRE